MNLASKIATALTTVAAASAMAAGSAMPSARMIVRIPAPFPSA